ncbi:MAG TPA: sulfatase [Acidimicrobiia bacterium]|nr:sulfatase [Acidimicrobiia bacterium]
MTRAGRRAGRAATTTTVRRATLLAAILFIAPVVVAKPALGAGPRARTADKPNIVVILTDDLDASTSADPARFPVLQDLMAGQGLTFSNFFVNESLCCPSRASILRGQYVHNHGVLGNGGDTGGYARFRELGEESSTVATWLHARGYRTSLFGKYLNGYPQTVAPTHVPRGWDEWDSPSGGNPYGEYRYELNENGRLVQYGTQPGDYLVDVLAKKAVDFIHENATSKQPLFMYVAPYVPHQPATPAPRYATAFPGVRAARPPSFDRVDGATEPSWLRQRPPLAPVIVRYIDDLYRRRLQDMLGVEDLLRGVVDALRSTGRLGDTYVLFTSDNGFHLGQHRLPPGKQTAYDEDIRVPLIVRGPGIPAGSTTARLAMNVDLAPTIAALAGARVPAFVDGRSLVPILHSPTAHRRWRTAAFVEHYGNARARARRTPAGTAPPATTTTQPATAFRPDAPVAPDNPDDDAGYNQQGVQGSRTTPRPPDNALNPYGIAIPSYQAVRTARYLYVEYPTGERQLFDVVNDPYEVHDLIGSAPRSLVRRLAHRLAELAICKGAGCRRADGGPPDHASGAGSSPSPPGDGSASGPARS